MKISFQFYFAENEAHANVIAILQTYGICVTAKWNSIF